MPYKYTLSLATLLSLISASVIATDTQLSTKITAVDAPLFSLNGKVYKEKDLQPRFQQALHSIELQMSENKEQVLEQAMLENHFSIIAKNTKRPVEDVVNDLLKVESITDDQVEAFYEKFKDRIGAPLKEIEPKIRETLEERQRQEKIKSLTSELKNKGLFVSLLDYPEAPVFEMNLSSYPSKGKKGAPIQLVEFADYRCTYCYEAKLAVDKILKEYPNQVQFFYVDYPVLDQNTLGISTNIAKGAYCAGKQGKFWDFYDKSYANVSTLTVDSAEAIAKELNLNQEQFKKCIYSNETESYMEEAIAFAQKLGVSSTPTFFINGQQLNIKNLSSDLNKEIESRLHKKKK